MRHVCLLRYDELPNGVRVDTVDLFSVMFAAHVVLFRETGWRYHADLIASSVRHAGRYETMVEWADLPEDDRPLLRRSKSWQRAWQTHSLLLELFSDPRARDLFLETRRAQHRAFLETLEALTQRPR